MRSESKLLITFCLVAAVFYITALYASQDAINAEVPPENLATFKLCLHVCGLCVQHWKAGLYNGTRCAHYCLKNKGHKVVDPDCVKIKMFNLDEDAKREHRKAMKQLRNGKNNYDEE